LWNSIDEDSALGLGVFLCEDAVIGVVRRYETDCVTTRSDAVARV